MEQEKLTIRQSLRRGDWLVEQPYQGYNRIVWGITARFQTEIEAQKYVADYPALLAERDRRTAEHRRKFDEDLRQKNAATFDRAIGSREKYSRWLGFLHNVYSDITAKKRLLAAQERSGKIDRCVQLGRTSHVESHQEELNRVIEREKLYDIAAKIHHWIALSHRERPELFQRLLDRAERFMTRNEWILN